MAPNPKSSNHNAVFDGNGSYGYNATMAKRKAQQEFKGKGFEKPKDWFGGSNLKSNPKVGRPLSSKLPLHIVLRANESRLRTPRNFRLVNEQVKECCRKHGIKIYEYANVGNHMHILVKLRSVRGWAAFIRELTGRISQLVQGLSGQEKGKAFWMGRPFTRVVGGWKRAYRIAKDYVVLNILESEGLIDRKSRTILQV